MMPVKAASQGLRRPPLSAMAPSAGLSSAVTMAPMLNMMPHCSVPTSLFGATALAK